MRKHGKILLVITLAFIGIISPNSGFAVNPNNRATALPKTLIDTLRLYLNYLPVNWTNNYYGLIFGKQDKANFESYINQLAADGKWADVLKWSARLKKLGIEQESAIKEALLNLPKTGELPTSASLLNLSYWHVYDRDLLFSTFYYSNKYGYLTDKWNATRAFEFLRNAIATNGSGGNPSVFYVYSDGRVSQMSNRYYDENAQTASAYLIFHELGIDSSLNCSIQIWNYVNNNHWNKTEQYFKYRLTSNAFECEAPYFSRIFSLLLWHEHALENFSRIAIDLQTRFLKNLWGSPQWRETPTGEVAHVVVHANPTNPQRRLTNTFGAWISLLTMYEALDLDSQIALCELLRGYNDTDPAWKMLYDPSAELYDDALREFRMFSDVNATSEATCMALALQALMGIIPLTTTLAIPMEEYMYEYNFDVDPNLFRIDVENNTLRVGVIREGSIQFIYGDLPVSCFFPESGVYEIAFSEDWNNITRIEKISNLPPDRKFFWWPSLKLEHDIAIKAVVPHGDLVPQGATLPVTVTVLNQGSFQENLTLTLYSNETIVDQLPDMQIQSCELMNVTMIWNTAGFDKGEYTLSAEASVVPNEINTEDNTLAALIAISVVIDGHDMAVKTAAISNYSTINVVFKNYGSRSEVFNITIFANSTKIYTHEFTLETGLEGRLEFFWNTCGLQRGNYIITTYIDPLPEEADVDNNLKTTGVITLYVGDVDGNGCVNMIDLYLVSSRFGTRTGEVGYDGLYDVNNDQAINMIDVYLVAVHYGNP